MMTQGVVPPLMTQGVVPPLMTQGAVPPLMTQGVVPPHGLPPGMGKVSTVPPPPAMKPARPGC
jgi:hypothetical protein